MANTARALRDLIVDKLVALTDDDSPGNPVFGEVYGYANGNFTSYPAATVLLTGGSTGRLIDSAHIERTYSFQATCYQEQSEAGADKETATEHLMELCETMIKAFDTDPRLGDNVERLSIVRMNFDFSAVAGTYQFATFQIDVLVVVPNY